MNIVITNLTSAEVYVRELYTSVKVGTPISLSGWSPSDLASATDLQTKVAAGTLSVTITPTVAELASGLLVTPGTVEAEDHASTAAAVAAGASYTMRWAVASGDPAAVELIAVGSVPRKLRILDAVFYCSTSPGASTITLQETSSADSLGLTFDTGATGRIQTAGTATATIDPADEKGLFAVRTDNGIVGELVITVRPET
jgi:hypothetical protein